MPGTMTNCTIYYSKEDDTPMSEMEVVEHVDIDPTTGVADWPENGDSYEIGKLIVIPTGTDTEWYSFTLQIYGCSEAVCEYKQTCL